MAKIDEIQKRLLEEVADLHDVPEGAYNLRARQRAGTRRPTSISHRRTTAQASIFILSRVQSMRVFISRSC